MKRNRVLIILGLLVLTLFTIGCGEKGNSTEANNNKIENENLTESGMPIVNEEITLKFFAGLGPSAQGDLNDVMNLNEYENMTNINIEWEQVPHDSIDEKRNLALVGGNLPDAFYAANFSNLDVFKYSQQGTLIELNDIIDEHAPNLKKILEEYPDIKKTITFPDGKIYSMPYLLSPEFKSLLANPLFYYNQDLLDDYGMDIPETTDEFYTFLQKVKEENPEIIPYGAPNIDGLVSWLSASFGIRNRAVPYIDMDLEKDEMRFTPTTERYKEMLEYMNKLYSEELIAQNIFTIEWNDYLSSGAEDKYASTIFYDPEELFGEEVGEKYEGGLPLEGPHGDQQVYLMNPVGNMGNFVITNENENPEATVRWADYFYSDEGSKLLHMGIEGESFIETADGEFEYVDEITDDPDGLTKEQKLSEYVSYIITGPRAGILKQEYFEGSESSEKSLETLEKLEPYITEDADQKAWPQFTYTEDEAKELTSLADDIEKYVDEMRDKFIVGSVSFAEWDNYVKTLDQMGLDDYMEIKKTAYDRYENN